MADDPIGATGGPLAGVRVLELGTVLMVPYAGQILGDLGADVVKVESFAGDPNRLVGRGLHPQLSGAALNINRNKRSIALDLASAEGRAVFAELVATCDVFVTNMRPAALTKLHLHYADLVKYRSDLVYCRSHGFASDTGDADRAAYDDIIQAASGLAGLSLRTDGEARLLPTVLADKVTGLTITYAVLAALFERERTGRGREIEVPMFDTILAFELVEHLDGATMRPPVGTPGYERVLNPHRRPHRTSDGWIVLMPYSGRDWQRIWGRLDDPEFPARLTGKSEADIKALAPAMYGRLATHMPHRTTDEWLTLCDDIDIAASAVPSLDEVVTDPAQHRGVLEPATHSVAGDYLRIREPARFAGSASSRREAPLVGQHGHEVLTELGMSDARIAELVGQGVVQLAEATAEGAAAASLNRVAIAQHVTGTHGDAITDREGQHA